MKENLKNLGKRLTNTGTLIGIVSTAFFILQQFGINFNLGAAENVVQGVLTIGVLLGILNNSETKGLYIPLIYRYQDEKDKLTNK